MLKAVLKKSREGGKGTKKDPGMNIIVMFYTPGELSTANPGLSILWCSSAHPGAAPCLPPQLLPARQLQCNYCCISSRQHGGEQLVVVVALEVLRAGCVCCAASSYTAWGQAC